MTPTAIKRKLDTLSEPDVRKLLTLLIERTCWNVEHIAETFQTEKCYSKTGDFIGIGNVCPGRAHALGERCVALFILECLEKTT